jgi:hypothetical protein
MAKRYGHIGQTALRSAVEAIADKPVENAKNPAGSFDNPFDLHDTTESDNRN